MQNNLFTVVFGHCTKVVDDNGKTYKVFDTENEAEIFIQVYGKKNLNSFGKLQLELLTKGRNHIFDTVPPENIRTEEDLYEYPFDDYEELYQLMIDDWETTQQNLFSNHIYEILEGLETNMLGEYVDTRIDW